MDSPFSTVVITTCRSLHHVSHDSTLLNWPEIPAIIANTYQYNAVLRHVVVSRAEGDGD